jgi:hypothetical protein
MTGLWREMMMRHKTEEKYRTKNNYTVITMRHKIMFGVLCVLILSIFVSCQLAQENAGTDIKGDRLIGVFVTTEPLFPYEYDFDEVLKNQLGNSQNSDITFPINKQNSQSRLYAIQTTKVDEHVETADYIFPDVSGFSFFRPTVPETEESGKYITHISDPEIWVSMWGYDSIEGTIYVLPTIQSRIYYFNPVFQSVDGSVFALPEYLGTLINGNAPTSYTQNETNTITENGESHTRSMSVKLSFDIMSDFDKVAVLQMDKDNNLLSQMEYTPDTFPDSISPKPETSYLIVESHSNNKAGTVSRSIHSKSNKFSNYDYDSDTTIEIFIARVDGICIKHKSQIEWP